MRRSVYHTDGKEDMSYRWEVVWRDGDISHGCEGCEVVIYRYIIQYLGDDDILRDEDISHECEVA